MKKQKYPTVGKIEIDDRTLDAKLVEVDIDELPKAEKITESEPEYLRPKLKSIGTQLVMHEYFLPEDKTIDKRQKKIKRILYACFIAIILVAVAYTAYRDFGTGKELAPASVIIDTLLKNWFYLPCALTALFFSYFFISFYIFIPCSSNNILWKTFRGIIPISITR